jgi:hypothetical protein
MKHLLSTGALLLCCTAVHASPISLGFSFNGFYDSASSSFVPEEVVSGSFTGEDLDGDGVLEKSELLSLVIDELDYIACAAASNAHYQCGATSFAFSAGSGLQFSVGSYGSDPEGWVGGGRLITTGDQHYAYDFNPGMTVERHLYWTSDTRLTMVSMATAMQAATEMPEPGSWALLGVGLLGMAWRGRRYHAAGG